MRVFLIILGFIALGAGATLLWSGFSIEPRVSSMQNIERKEATPSSENAIGTAPNALLNPPTSGYGIISENAAAD